MTIGGTAPLSRQLSPSVQQIPSYDRQMMEATLNVSPASPFPAAKSSSSLSSTAASPTTAEAESRRLLKNEPSSPGMKNLWGLIGALSPIGSNEDKPKTRSRSATTSSTPIPRRPSPPVPKINPSVLPSSDDTASQPPQNGFTDDPMGLGITDMPTMGHAEKVQRRGERKVKLGSLMRSGRLQAQGQHLLAKSDMIRAQAVELTKDEQKDSPGITGKQKRGSGRRGTL